ncbi:EVE domain-containing protein [Sulfurisphaera javensis]|uniref:EVE domain-containing protein n=1 Tax=Sulfurisphaera javensis TaxID=2049879 RepID=A0AAT9GS40_9CREN
MAYWIIPVQEDMWETILKTHVFGFRRESPQKYIKPGDYIIFYVGKYYAKKYGGKFVGIFKVISDWYYDETVLFPNEKLVGKAVEVYRIKLEPILVGECDSKDLIRSLSFIEDKFQFSKYLRNVPANLKRPIPEEDVKKIEECIRSSIV